MSELSNGGDSPDPTAIVTRSDFARSLTELRERASLTVRDVAKVAGMQASTVGGYFGGRHLPPLKPADVLPGLLRACGVTDDATILAWAEALLRVRRVPGRRPAGAPVPYRGLASFQPEDADWFFGREALTRTLVERVTTAANDSVLLVVGPSGAGKSSLLRAGLVAALGPADASAAATPGWCCVLMTPGPHPLQSLTEAVSAHTDTASRLVLVIDQFEETFTACADEQERRAFIAAISGSTTPGAAAGPVWARVVLGLRADFYAQLLNDADLAKIAQDAQLVVGPMTEEELRRAIEEPARMAKAECEPGLVEIFLRDLSPASRVNGAAYDAGALPLLSHALLATWERGQRRHLTVVDYREAGGIAGAVAQTAERVYSELDADQRELTRRLFIRMVIVSDEAADTRRRVPIAEFLDDQDAAEVLDHFVDHRLITADAETVEISHEALIGAWPRLRGWINADRAELLLAQQVADAATRWDRESRDPGALYRGARLAAATQWAEGGTGLRPSPLSAEFIRASVRQERRRTVRLYQTIASLSVLLLVAVVAGIGALQQRGEATRERNAAISRLVATRADRVRDKDVALAAQLSLAAYRITPTTEALASLLDASATQSATRLLGGAGVMQSVALTPDKRTLAAGGADKTVRLWDTSDPRRPVALGPPLRGPTDTIFSVAFSPDGHTLAAGSGDSKVHLWDVGDPRHPRPLGDPLTGPAALVYSVAFSPDGRSLAAGSGDHAVYLWNVTDPSKPAVAGPPMKGATSYVQSVAFSPNSATLAAGSDDTTVRLWDIRDPSRPSQVGAALTGPTRRVYSVAFSPDGRTLAAGSADNQVYLWDVTNPASPVELGKPISGPSSWVNMVAFSPSGATLALASSGSAVWLWDLRANRLTANLPHPGPVTSVIFDGEDRVVSSAADGVARIWHLPGTVLSGHSDLVNGIAFSPDKDTLAIGSAETQLWSTRQRRQIGSNLVNPDRSSTAVAFTPDARTLAVASRDGTVQLWDLANLGEPVRIGEPIKAHGDVLESLAFSPDGRTLATGGDDQLVRLWDVTDRGSPQLLATLDGFASYVFSVVFSPDGRTLAAGSIDKTVRIWNVTDPRRPALLGQPLLGPDHYVLAVAFSPDGRTLALGSANKTIWLFDMTDPARPARLGQPLGGPTNYVYALAFSPDGHTLAAGNTDESVWLWNVADRNHPTVVATLTVPVGAVYTVAFHPDGHTIAAGGRGNTVWLWETDPDRVIAQICGSAGDPITADEWAQYVPDLEYQAPCREP